MSESIFLILPFPTIKLFKLKQQLLFNFLFLPLKIHSNMNFIKNLLGLLFVIISLSACNNKVDINTDYEDISIVYGLLDASESRHYIKLTKAFQSDGNVYLTAADGSVQQYNPADIDMWLEEYKNGYYVRKIPLDTVLITNKDTGDFYYPNQILWATAPNTILSNQASYKIIINNTALGKTIKSETNMVGDFSITKPNSGQKYASFSGILPQLVEWRSAENGYIYQLNIRFFYSEVNNLNQVEVKHVDLQFGQKKSGSTAGGVKMQEEFYGSIFYQNLKSKIALPEPGMRRFADSLHFIFSVADENFSVYMDINKPSTSIVDERPSFTNVENGLGIFAGRYNKTRYFVGLAPNSLDSLIDGQYTNLLGFEKYPVPKN